MLLTLCKLQHHNYCEPGLMLLTLHKLQCHYCEPGFTSASPEAYDCWTTFVPYYVANHFPSYTLPAIIVSSCGFSKPLLGRTQYCLGAVVLTLNITVSFVGLANLRSAVTTSLNGPVREWVSVCVCEDVCSAWFTMWRWSLHSIKPGSQYDAGAYVASVASSLVHNMTLELT